VGLLANERLRAAIHEAGLGPDDVAEALGKDRKTVDRWIDGHVPYRRNQHCVAKLLAVDPGYLWPPVSAEQSRDLGMAELVSLWPVRSHVGNDTWLGLFERAQRRIDVLVYAGFWLSEDPAIRRLLSTKSESGVRVRFLLGDPHSAAVDLRGVEEGIGSAVAAKIDNTIHNYQGVIAAPNTEFRLHATTLYNSVYRGDDEMLVNTHLYGLPGHMTPLMHLRRVPGAELFAAYLDSFERVWELARPLDTRLQVA
jgi:lambda repressor-like predicted transcriptional regulator